MNVFSIGIVFGLLSFLVGRAQPPFGVETVRLDQWPARLQLFPRDETGQCTVRIAGRVPVGSASAVSLVVRRDRQRYETTRVLVDAQTGQFTFAPRIRAELSEYGFDLFVHPLGEDQSDGDSVRVASRDSIVCGDVFLITGQSNAVGRFDNRPYRNEFCRTFGTNDNKLASRYNPADTLWCLSNTTEGMNSLWGVELQRLIAEQYGIPTAVINGGASSSAIYHHLPEGGAGNLATLYGKLLYRVRKAGVAGHVKALIWRQGEAEAASNIPGVYEQTYPQLYGNWKRDYPGLQRVYQAQLNLLTTPSTLAGRLREFQRQIATRFPDHEPLATVGLPAYDGIHYGEAGYRQFGQELFRLVARDFYGSADSSNIRSPNLRRAYYRTPVRDEITLEFEPGQDMRWSADTTLVNPANGFRYQKGLSEVFFGDDPSGESNFIRSGRGEQNRIVLKLNKSLNAQTLTYMPSSYRDGQTGYYAGPTLRNRREMRALTFYQVPIALPLPVATDLRAAAIDTSYIRLTWDNTPTNTDAWLVERADSTDQFVPIARLTADRTHYNDLRMTNQGDSLRIGAVYQYRVRAVGSRAEADYSPVVRASLRTVLATRPTPEPPTAVVTYPNPARDVVSVRLPPNWSSQPVGLTLTDEVGRMVLRRTERTATAEAIATFSVAELPAGFYVLIVAGKPGEIRCRVVVSH